MALYMMPWLAKEFSISRKGENLLALRITPKKQSLDFDTEKKLVLEMDWIAGCCHGYHHKVSESYEEHSIEITYANKKGLEALGRAAPKPA